MANSATDVVQLWLMLRLLGTKYRKFLYRAITLCSVHYPRFIEKKSPLSLWHCPREREMIEAKLAALDIDPVKLSRENWAFTLTTATGKFLAANRAAKRLLQVNTANLCHLNTEDLYQNRSSRLRMFQQIEQNSYALNRRLRIRTRTKTFDLHVWLIPVTWNSRRVYLAISRKLAPRHRRRWDTSAVRGVPTKRYIIIGGAPREGIVG